jgi:hypothetical protein
MRVSRSVDDAFGISAELRRTACTAARVNETPGDHDLRYASEVSAETEILPITAEAVKSALWLSLYGFQNMPDGRMDSAYHRSCLVSELHSYDRVLSDVSTTWLKKASLPIQDSRNSSSWKSSRKHPRDISTTSSSATRFTMKPSGYRKKVRKYWLAQTTEIDRAAGCPWLRIAPVHHSLEPPFGLR